MFSNGVTPFSFEIIALVDWRSSVGYVQKVFALWKALASVLTTRRAGRLKVASNNGVKLQLLKRMSCTPRKFVGLCKMSLLHPIHNHALSREQNRVTNKIIYYQKIVHFTTTKIETTQVNIPFLRGLILKKLKRLTDCRKLTRVALLCRVLTGIFCDIKVSL